MADEKGNDDKNKKEDTQKKTEDKKTEEAHTFTQEELDEKIGERLKREREKSEEEFDKRLEKKLADERRKAKLSAEEKEAERRKEEQAEMAESKRNIALRENRVDARELLQERNISADLVDFVVDVDADKTKENITSLEKAYNKAVEAGVADKLKGETPKDKSNNNDLDTTDYGDTTVL